jgi:hypothetical protein
VLIVLAGWPEHLYAQACAVSSIPGTETVDEHFADFVHDTASESSLPLTLLAPAATAAIVQYVPGLHELGYGSNGAAYAQHYGVSLLDTVDGRFERDFAFPVLFRQNPHYAATHGSCSFKQRVVHVLKNLVLTDSGKLNVTAVPASMGAAAISNLYVPDAQRTLCATLTRIATNEAGHLAGMAYEEFCPDIKRKISFLPCPSKVSLPLNRKIDVFKK